MRPGPDTCRMGEGMTKTEIDSATSLAGDGHGSAGGG